MFVLVLNVFFDSKFIDSDCGDKVVSGPERSFRELLFFFLIQADDLPFKMLTAYKTENL